MRAIGRWLVDHPWVVSVVALSLAILIPVALQRHADATERQRDRLQAIEVIAARARENCLSANSTITLLRTVGVQSDVATATASNEALIAVASAVDPSGIDPAVIEQLRQTTIAQATERSTAIYSQVPDRDCRAEEHNARRDAQRALER